MHAPGPLTHVFLLKQRHAAPVEVERDALRRRELVQRGEAWAVRRLEQVVAQLDGVEREVDLERGVEDLQEGDALGGLG